MKYSLMTLCISIPTYRRPDFLYKNIHEVMRQASNFADICIYVADDFGSEENHSVIERLRAEFPDVALRYDINAKNLGIDENIKKCILTPDAEYVWLLGEDDLLVDGALAKMREVLLESRPVFAFANYVYTDNNHEKLASHAVLKDQAPLATMPFSVFARTSLSLLGFIGGCVINKCAWAGTEYEKFSGSYYSHVGGIIDFSVGRDIVVFGDLMVLNRAESAETFTWSKSTFDVYFSFHEVLDKSRLKELGVDGQLARANAYALFAVYSLVWLAAKRADGVYDSLAFRRYYASSEMGPVRKFFAYLISILPRAPLKMLRRLHLSNRFRRTLRSIS